MLFAGAAGQEARSAHRSSPPHASPRPPTPPKKPQPNHHHPSFYFVSDPVLLEILSLGSDPPSVVPHLQSGLFDAVASASFDRADPRHRISELVSPQGERLRLEGGGVDARGGGAEVWLQRLVDGMRSAVRGSIRRAARDVQALGGGGGAASGGAGGSAGGGAAAGFVLGSPAQAALLGLQLLWTADMQGALAAARAGDRAAVGRAFRRADALLRCVDQRLHVARSLDRRVYLSSLRRQPPPTPHQTPKQNTNSELVSVTVRSDLTKVQRVSLETCITVHMHQRDSAEELQRRRCRDPGDFEWQRQVRCYWREVS